MSSTEKSRSLPPKIIDVDPSQPADPDAVPGNAPPGAVSALKSSLHESETSTVNGIEPAAGCSPIAESDGPHLSATLVHVSAHAWWFQNDCDNNRADVQACLYEWYTDGTFHRKECNSNPSQKPGQTSSRWLNVRLGCASFETTTWSVVVDVDVNWEVDGPGVHVEEDDVDCRVY